MSASSSAISASRAWWRRARQRSAWRVACSASWGSRRCHASARATSCLALRSRSASRRSSGAVRMRLRSCRIVCVRDFTALARAIRSTRIASTIPSRDFGAASSSPSASTLAAAASASRTSFLPRWRAALALGAGDFEHLDALERQAPRERDPVGAGAFDAGALDAAAPLGPGDQRSLPRLVVANVSASTWRPRRSTSTAVCVLRSSLLRESAASLRLSASHKRETASHVNKRARKGVVSVVG